MKVPRPVEAAARPRPTDVERVPMVRARLRVSGLSRQASRMTMVVLPSRSISIWRSTNSSFTASNSSRARARAWVRLAPLRTVLQAVAGVEEEGDVRTGERIGEDSERAVERAAVGVQRLHHLE